jgi:hypothetical protein
VCNSAITSKTSDEKKEMSDLSPVSPFRSLLVHFGMLLGVDDFETIDSYHRGKMWLHNAWLHRQNTVWGLGVSVSEAKDELRVAGGLAVDGLGRELYLENAACLDISSWYEEHRDDPELQAIVKEDADGAIHFDAYVAIRFKGCLARQVPALTEPCDSSGATTAYSRVIETVELLLLPGNATEWRMPPGVLPYHRLRLFCGLEEPIKKEDDTMIPTDKEVLDALGDILALAAEEQPPAYLKAFRRFSALDEMDLAPASGEEGDAFSLFPIQDPALLPLANIKGITLVPVESGGWHLTGGEIDNTVRPVHLPTSTIQDLLCGPGCSCSPVGPDIPPADAGGPRIDAGSVSIQGEKITFKVASSTLLKASVQAKGLSVTSFDLGGGWNEEKIRSVTYDTMSKEVTIMLGEAPDGNLVRLIVSGTGKFPFLGENWVPLAGAMGGLPGDKMNGNDFVFMFKARD